MTDYEYLVKDLDPDPELVASIKPNLPLKEKSLLLKKMMKTSWCLLPLDHLSESHYIQGEDNKEILEAARCLLDQREQLIFHVSGPVTVYHQKLGTDEFFRLLRQPEKLEAALMTLLKQLEPWYMQCDDLGIKWLAIHDPVANENIYGPSSYEACFLKSLLYTLSCFESPVFIHPAMAQPLVKRGYFYPVRSESLWATRDEKGELLYLKERI